MATLPDGREVVARLELPLPLTLTAELMRGIAKTLERIGYTDVVVLTDGTVRIIAKPPGWTAPADPQSGPAAPEEGAPTAPSP